MRVTCPADNVSTSTGDSVDQRSDVGGAVVVGQVGQRSGAAANASRVDGDRAEAAAREFGADQAEGRRRIAGAGPQDDRVSGGCANRRGAAPASAASTTPASAL